MADLKRTAMRFRSRIYGYSCLAIISVLTAIYLTNYFFKKASIGGEYSERILKLSQLNADIAPPALSLLNAHLLVHHLVDYYQFFDVADFNANLAGIARARSDLLAKVKGWKTFYSNEPEILSWLQQIEVSGLEYFDHFNSYVSNFEKKSGANRIKNSPPPNLKSFVNQCDNLFKRNQILLDSLMENIAEYSAQLEIKTQKEIRQILILQASMLVLIFFAVFIFLIQFVVRQNQKLEDLNQKSAQAVTRIQELNFKLEEQTAKLKTSNEDLEAFSYSVAHDLRSPLRSINGFSQILADDYKDKLDAQGVDYLQRVIGATVKMSQLIEDVLEVGRVTRDVVTKRRFDLKPVLSELIESKKAEYGRPNAEIEIPKEMMVIGDQRLLGIAFENILDNAFKFSAKKMNTKIKVEFDLNSNRISVSDNGVGFEPQYANKLFKMFQRLHSQTDFSGSGIGLATVERIVRKHDGKVWASSALGEGTTVSVHLPNN